MGEKKMSCPKCGTENVNKMLVEFIVEDEDGRQYNDITTLPKFLYYLEHPTDRRTGSRKRKEEDAVRNYLGIKDTVDPYKIIKTILYCCRNCMDGKPPEHRKDTDMWYQKIPSRRYGI